MATKQTWVINGKTYNRSQLAELKRKKIDPRTADIEMKLANPKIKEEKPVKEEEATPEVVEEEKVEEVTEEPKEEEKTEEPVKEEKEEPKKTIVKKTKKTKK